MGQGRLLGLKVIGMLLILLAEAYMCFMPSLVEIEGHKVPSNGEFFAFLS